MVEESTPIAPMKKVWEEFLDGEKNMRDGSLSGKQFSFLSSTSSLAKELGGIHGNNEKASKVLHEITKSPSATCQQVFQALQYGADASWRCPFTGQCSLHHLAEHGQFRILKLLSFIKTLSFNVKDEHNQTPLMAACRAKPSASNSKVIKVLLRRRDCGLDDLDHRGHSALYYAWEGKNIAALRRVLLARGSLFNCIREFAEEIPLVYELQQFLEPHADVSTLANIPKPRELNAFFSATLVYPLMVDYYSQQDWMLTIRAVLTRQPRAVVDGMVLFGLREEIRSMKKYPMAPRKVQEIVLEVNDADDDASFQASVQQTRMRRQEIKMMKVQNMKEKRQAKEHEEHEEKKKLELERIEKMFAFR